MAKMVIVPKLGPAIEEGLLVSWLVKEGSFVKRGTPLFAIETDKSVIDCESTDDGYLSGITAPEGSTVQVDQVLATLTESVAGEKQEAGSGDRAESSVSGAPELTSHDETDSVAGGLESMVGQIAGTRVRQAEAKFNEVFAVPVAAPEQPRHRASPRARRAAREAGIAIDRLVGADTGGRLAARDVAAFIQASVASGSSRAAPARPALAGVSRDIPLSTMRRAIARRMSESAQQSPVFFTTAKIEADALLEMREQLKNSRSLLVSVNDILVKACALALASRPRVNATFHGDFVRLHDSADIAVAVATEEGLITPIVRNAGRKSLEEISSEIRVLANSARAGRLPPDTYTGGTFTVSNLGMYGVEDFTAILNLPQCAILAAGGIDKELRLRAGTVVEHNVLRVTLTADHRAIDGAEAAQFLGQLKSLLENPAGLLV